MPGNTQPIFPATPNTPLGVTVTAANTAKDGTGTVSLIFTAGDNGSRVDYVRFMPLGTNVATVGRVFENNGSTPTVATNNSMIGQVSLPATTNTETAALAWVDLPFDISLPAGYKLYVTLGTAVASGYAITAFGGDY